MSLSAPNLGAPNLGLGELPVVSAAFDEFLNDASRAGNVIVEVIGFPKSAAPLQYPFNGNLGFVNLGLEYPPGEFETELVTMRFQSHDVTFAHDDPVAPNYKADARLAERANLSKYLGVRPDTSDAGQVQVNSGIKFRDQDRIVEEKINTYNIDGRRVRILLGPKGYPSDRSVYREVVTTYGIDWTRDVRGDALLRVQDLQFRLSKQFQSREFGGSGGLEGGEDLIGRLKPRLFGERFHFEPILIDAPNETYMINDNPIEGSVVLYFGGHEADYVGDFADYNTLIAATIPEGGYATANAVGIVRCRSAGGIEAPITVTAKGDNVGGYSALYGDMVYRIFTGIAGLAGSEYDNASLGFLNIGEGSFWFDGTTRMTVRDVVTQLAFEGGGRIVADNRIGALALVDPSDSAYSHVVKAEEILREPVLEGRAGKSVRSFAIRWKPNDRVLTDDEIILPDIEPEFKASLKKPYITTTATTDATARHIDYEDQITIETSANAISTVAVLIARLKSFWRRERYLWTFLLSKRALFFQLGEVIQITYPNAVFAEGQNGLIVDIGDLDFENQTAEITVLV